MQQKQPVIWEESEGVAIATLNRPESRNGMTAPLIRELHARLVAVRDRKDVHVVMLRGAGGHFCPGADLAAPAEERGIHASREAFEIAVLLHQIPQVTLAAIQGACAGAGLGWAAACDLRICGAGARFNTAFLDVGLSGDMGGPWTLPRLVGSAVARELYFMPGKFDAARAKEIGLVSQVAADEDFDDVARGMVAAIAQKAPLALRAMKQNFVDAESMDFPHFIVREGERHLACGTSEDALEARKAFLEKRKPKFAGR